MAIEYFIRNPEITSFDDVDGNALPVAAAQTFTSGAFLKWNGTALQEAAGGDKLQLVLALEAANPDRVFWPIPKTEVMYNTLKAVPIAINAYTATTNTPALGTKYAIIKDANGIWRLNCDDSVTNPVLTVIGLFNAGMTGNNFGASLTDTNVRVLAITDDAACFAGLVG